MWNGVASSLTTCVLNCSAAISNCKQNDCTSPTFCTVCDVGYGLNLIDPANQNCIDCPTAILNCK